jgi:asparagine synthase (glutamine-hydrolysing)
MCGFAGFLKTSKDSFNTNEVIQSMTLSLAHRGPDDNGIWVDDNSNIAIGHRRLSIVELSKAGHQPMHSHKNQFVIVFNGEIYNHLAIRHSLEKDFGDIPWKGGSDTETLLTAFELVGVDKTLESCIGMFSFALWDKHRKRLILGRDRMGEKPLYYGWSKQDFLFGSELKAFKKYPSFNNLISQSALLNYMQFSYVPGPQSIYKDIYKVPPGSYIIINFEKLHKKDIELKYYWKLENVIQEGQKNLICNKQDALSLMESALEDSVAIQMLADVPVGAFLSGGVDSSLISSLMQEQSSVPIKTFSVGFDEQSFNEAPYAKKIAEYIRSDHTEIYVSDNEARDVIPLLPEIYDEPFADSSQIPTYIISKIAKSNVSVALSGDAGDELFGGYNRYFWGPSIWSKLKYMPAFARNFFSKLLTLYSPQKIDKFLGQNLIIRPGEKFHKLARTIQNVSSIQDLYLNLVRDDPVKNILINNSLENINFYETSSSLRIALQASSSSEAQQMMHCDAVSYLPDDILCKVDRASMASSLETRVPFLDHRVVELAWRIPINMNISGNQGKLLLKEILYKRIPRELIERPKSGFGIPLGDWLRGPLRGWVEDLISRDRLTLEGNFCAQSVHEIWRQHLSGDFDWSSRLWNILMFQAWLERS